MPAPTGKRAGRKFQYRANLDSIRRRAQQVERKRTTRAESAADADKAAVPAPASHAGQNYPATLQENLLAALCHHEAGREVAALLNASLFEGDYRLLAERAVAYWQQYDRPPGPHASDLIADILGDKYDRRAGTYRSILIEMLRLADSGQFNVEYILDDIKTFHQQQNLLLAMQGSLRALQARGDPKAAIARANELFTEALQDPGPGRLIARPVSMFKRRKRVWVRRPFFMRGVLNLITGDGGLGKTLIALDAAARLSQRGQATVFLTIEDEPDLDLRPRLEAAGGDPNLLLCLGVEDEEDFDLIDSLSDKRLREIEQIITARGDVGMLVVDPFADFSGKTDHYSETEVRRALKPLRALARHHNLVVAIVVHLNKKQDVAASGRIAGSMAFRNVPRSVMLVVPDPEEPERTLMIQHKTNLIGRDTDNAVGFTTRFRRGAPTIIWEKELFRVDADEVMGARPGRPSKQGAAVELLRELLADGPVAVGELEAAFQGRDISWATATRVKAEVRVRSFQKARKWYWELLA